MEASDGEASDGDYEEDPDFVHSEVDIASELDDSLYDRNVTDGIEIGTDMTVRRNDVVMNIGDVEDDELQYPSSEELVLVCSSDEDDAYRFPEFLAETDMSNPQFEVGQLFRSMPEFRTAVRTYGALNGYNVMLKCNDRKRAQGVCKLGCTWKIWASKLSTTEAVQVKFYTSEHTCSRSQTNRHCNYIFLTNRYIEQFKADPDWKTQSILATVKDDLKTEISRNVANKMRKYAKELLFGTMEEQFGLLRRYVAEVLRTNPGSTVMIASDEQVFKGIYICFSACKAGFKIGCRKVIGVDGCHLRGYFGGIMLTAVGLDANDCIYPVAYAVVQKENADTWRWFMKYLQEDIEIGNGGGWTLMTDRQKGLQNVCEELFPEAEHRFCVRHMYTNFFTAGHKSKLLKDFLWRAAKSTTIPEFRYWMQKIRDASEDAYGWLIKRHPQEWSRSHFPVHSKCDILLNNICEVFNKILLDDREKMILNMLTSVQKAFMKRIQQRREKMRQRQSRLCPRIIRKLRKIAEISRECTLHLSGGPRWEVDYSSGTYVVDLEARNCACRKWELTGLPCMHAVAVIRDCRNEPEDFVDNCYTVETYMNCYNNILNPINGKMLWPEVDAPTIIQPKWKVIGRGENQKKRRKQAEELVVQSQGKSYIKKKGQVTMTCSVCGLKGHNKRYHARANAPGNEWFDTEVEPVHSNIERAVDERGKIVSSRDQGLASTENLNEEEPIHFMLTPMVARDTRRNTGGSSPTTSVLADCYQRK